jgi:branched-subunit amino acid aminotransferase/4-amino-4-deoxychorismate lyase
VDELVAADAVFVVNAVRGITPVRMLRDARGAVLGATLSSHRHAMVMALRERWSEELDATASV